MCSEKPRAAATGRVAGRRDVVADRPDLVAQAELAHHLGSQGSGRGQVVGGARGCLAADQPLGGPAAQPHSEGVGEVALPVEPPVIDGQHLGEPEGLPGTEDRDSADRVGVRGQDGDQRVAGLVHGDCGEFAGRERAGVPGAEQHAIARAGKVGCRQADAAVPDRADRGLVEQVGQVGTGESRRGGGDLIQVSVGVEALITGVGGEDGATLSPVGQRDNHFPVEPAGPAQGRVQGVRPVGSSEHYDPAGLVESVHLGE